MFLGSFKKLTVAVALSFACGMALSDDIFMPLFRTIKVKGDAYVIRPNETEKIPLVSGYAYPYGSTVVLPYVDPLSTNIKSEVTISFAKDYNIKLTHGTTLVVDKVGEEDKKIEVDVKNGSLTTLITIATTQTGNESLDKKMEFGKRAIVVKTPVAECTHLIGRNDIRVASTNGIYKAGFVSPNGTMEISGPQFFINKMRKNSAFEVSGDGADYTRIACKNGYGTVRFDRGTSTQNFLFKTDAVGKIWRSYADLSGKMAVGVIIILSDGKVTSFQYLEGGSAAVDSLEDMSSTGGVSATDTTSFETAESDPFGETSTDDGFESETSSSGDDFGSSDDDSYNFDDDSWDF